MSEYAQNEKDFQEKVFDYLDSLRMSGKINMYGSIPYVMSAFAIDKLEASKLFKDWTKTFKDK